MFTNVKNKFSRDSLIKLMLFIAEGTASQFGYCLAPADKVAKITAADATMVENVTVPAGVNIPQGQVAVKATTAGLAAVTAYKATSPETPSEPAAPVAPVEYKIESITELPQTNRGGRKATNLYPFDQLAAPVVAEGKPTEYSSFLIPGKAKKSVSSIVSAANKRFASTPPAATDRKFTVRDMDGGARVIRLK